MGRRCSLPPGCSRGRTAWLLRRKPNSGTALVGRCSSRVFDGQLRCRMRSRNNVSRKLTERQVDGFVIHVGVAYGGDREGLRSVSGCKGEMAYRSPSSHRIRRYPAVAEIGMDRARSAAGETFTVIVAMLPSVTVYVAWPKDTDSELGMVRRRRRHHHRHRRAERGSCR